MFPPMEGLLKHAMPARIRPARRRSTPWSLGPKTAVPGDAGVVAGHRYYSPGLGRWTSRDPIGERGGTAQLSGVLSGDRGAGRSLPGPVVFGAEPDFVFVANNPAAHVDTLGLCTKCAGDKPEGVGSACCPACEIKDLRHELFVVSRILANYQAGLPAGHGFAPGKLVRVAYTRCDPLGFIFMPTAGRPHTEYPPSGMETCRGPCIVAHEEVHRKQCIHEYLSFSWAGGYAKSYDQEQAMEIPAYKAEISCLHKVILRAEAEAKVAKSMLKACICCRRSQLSK